MQIARLFEILCLLLERKVMTAGELAERFEVNRRTVYRDIDALASAGIPVYATRGRGGGIRLMEGYVLNRTLLSDEEQEEILAALKSMGATGQASLSAVAKLTAIFHKEETDWIQVDYSDWNGGTDYFSPLKEAVLGRVAVEILYYGREGSHQRRVVEPGQLLFKHRAWYLRAFCRTRQDWRTFKLSRIGELRVTGERFSPRPLPETPEPVEAPAIPSVFIRLRFQPDQAHRVYDEFAPEVVRWEGNSLLVEVDYPQDESLYGYLMSFGDGLEVLEPEALRTGLREHFLKACRRYGEI